MKVAILLFFIGGSLAVEPTFNALERNYPLYDAIDWDGLVTREGLQDAAGNNQWLLDLASKNTCAMRISHAFIKAGKRLSPGSCNWAGVRDRNGNSYIIRVATMRCYLVNEYGNPDITGDSADDFQHRKGIIVMERCGWSDATGHVDLWDGTACVGKCYDASGSYFDRCSDIRLYQFH
ncbi:uncharacterized protein LOC144878803 [Branchiostoma floridae x Branchiostoma japonicum]